MLLAVHAAVGALAGNAVESPTAAFALGFVSHFFIDMIPHGDAHPYEGYRNGDRKRAAYMHVVSDVIATIALIVVLFVLQDFISPVNVSLGIIAGLLPDVIVGLYEIIEPRRNRWLYRRLEQFHVLHMNNHCLLGRFLPGQQHERAHQLQEQLQEQAEEFLYDLKFNIKKFTERDIPMRYGLMLQGITLAVTLKVIL